MFAALSSATRQTMAPEFGGKWRTELLNTAYSAICEIQREAEKKDKKNIMLKK